MQIQSINPPLQVNSILDTSLVKALNETDETGGALEELNSTSNPVQTHTQYLEPEPGLAPRNLISYDMYGGLQSDGPNAPGTHVDTYV
jgi:hypothetical protein